MRIVRRVFAYVAAVIVTALVASVVQTQFNLGALQALGAPVPIGVRFGTTGQDLAGFTPAFGVLTALAFLIAFLATGLLRRWLPRGRTQLFVAAGAVAVTAMLLIMAAVFGLVPIAAARGAAGFASLALCGALGGWVFARLSPHEG